MFYLHLQCLQYTAHLSYRKIHHVLQHFTARLLLLIVYNYSRLYHAALLELLLYEHFNIHQLAHHVGLLMLIIYVYFTTICFTILLLGLDIASCQEGVGHVKMILDIPHLRELWRSLFLHSKLPIGSFIMLHFIPYPGSVINWTPYVTLSTYWELRIRDHHSYSLVIIICFNFMLSWESHKLDVICYRLLYLGSSRGWKSYVQLQYTMYLLRASTLPCIIFWCFSLFFGFNC